MDTAIASKAALSVVGTALSPFKDGLLEKWAASNKLGSNVKDLELELLAVQALLEHTVGKEIVDNSALKRLLVRLQELGYDAEDVLDELEYFRIQDELDGTFHAAEEHAKGCACDLALHMGHTAKAVGKQIVSWFTCCPTACCNRPTNGDPGKHFPCSSLPCCVRDGPQKLRFNRVDASTRMQHIIEQLRLVRGIVSSTVITLGPNWSTVPNIAQSRPTTTSESIERKLYGRDVVRDRIVKDITEGEYSSKPLTVIPIVGAGGIGKTTLAQYIYNNKEVQQRFDVKVWTCVSLNFNVQRLVEMIEKDIRHHKVDGEKDCTTSVELIRKRLENKRFLLVLDDLWDCSNEDEWERLLVPLKKSQVQGNIILVTTRSAAQAKMVKTIDCPKYLKGLEPEELKDLFLNFIFGDEQSRKEHTHLLGIGDEIVKRLKGSPLAAKTVGRLLKTQLNPGHWNRVLDSKEWEQSKDKNDIMPALKLSYDYLPSQLQRCFSYCALFPQDYKFERGELINFWIGIDILHSSRCENKRVEDIGLSHLIELVEHGFFEKAGGKDESTCYILHDLLHELARKVTSHECLTIDSSRSQLRFLQIPPSIRHLSINIDNTSVKDRSAIKNCVGDFKTLDKKLKVEKLRTLMLFGEHHGCLVKVFGDLFREAKALRTVFLSETSYDVEDLLQNFYSLVHLRYLWIRGSDGPYSKTRTFHNKLSRFYHMVILDAKKFQIIQRDMSNLEKLRHFHVKNGSRVAEVGKVKSLQELREVFWVKREGQGFELKQIGNLAELSGSLSIVNLQNIQVVEEADEAKLMHKSRLQELNLCWNRLQSIYNIDYFGLDEHVLERLEPSSNLQKLSIQGNRGHTCPSWLGTNLSVKILESLCLDNVIWKTFPPIGDLWLVNASGEEISRRMPEKRFVNLRRLELKNLLQLERWVVHAPCQLFPSLEVIDISYCSNLVELSFSHSACCQQEELGNVFRKLSSLKIENCHKLSSFPILLPGTNEATGTIHIEGTGSSCFDGLFCKKDQFNAEYSLTIHGKGTPDSKFWNVLAFDNLTKLKEFDMIGCQPPPLRHLQKLSSLRKLRMSCSSNAFPFVEADSHIEYKFPVETLAIIPWSASGKDLTQLLSYFPKLSQLSLTAGGEKISGLGVMEQQDTATPGPSSSSANKLDEQRQQQDAITEERLVALEAAEGLLLLPPQLQELCITSCPELSLRCSNPLGDNKEDGGTIVGGGLQGLRSLRELWISICPKILSSYSSSSSHSSCFPFPSSLEDLRLEGGKGMETTLVPLSNLSSLTSLTINRCGDLRGDGLLSLLTQGSLTSLFVFKTPNFFVDSDPSRVHEQELPPRSSKLRHLRTDDVAGFIATPICSLLFSSLTKLGIHYDEVVERFTEEQEDLLFVNSLEEIIFYSCNNLQYLPARIHRLPNLKRLRIQRCKAIQMLPKDGLPSSLQELEIMDCPEIRSLPKDGLPSSLQKLVIWECPAIRSLPKVDNLPSSMRELYVEYWRSDELKTQCRKLIGIIPIVRVPIWGFSLSEL